jgi:DNA (cytosine-5)-methyltransferase 1
MIVDLFSGPGGWDTGARAVGLEPIGLEKDKQACMTRAAAGHPTIRTDVAAYPTGQFKDVTGLIASPPCQSFSVAGNGRNKGIDDPRGQLVFQVLRWVDDLRPEWVACEQVPPVLNIWKSFAYEMEKWGYRTWVGTLNAANYGVPQTRERAFLLASRSLGPTPPPPTHAKVAEPESLFGPGRLKWITMAEALGWGLVERPSTTLMAGEGRQGGACPLDGGSGSRAVYEKAKQDGTFIVEDSRGEGFGRSASFDASEQPSRTLTSKARSWKLQAGSESQHANRYDLDGPAPTIAFGKDDANWKWHEETIVDSNWPQERPATTVMGDPRIFAPGRHKGNDPKYGGTDRSDGAIRVQPWEAGVLQGFPPDYPWQGSRTSQFGQIGNAVPPPVAEAILRVLCGVHL